MGFPDSFQIPVSDTQAYRQFGNSVVMPVMQEVARIMTPHVLAQIARMNETAPHLHCLCFPDGLRSRQRDT